MLSQLTPLAVCAASCQDPECDNICRPHLALDSDPVSQPGQKFPLKPLPKSH